VHIQLKLKQSDTKIPQIIEGALRYVEYSASGVYLECEEPIAAARLAAIFWTRVYLFCKEEKV
jgi:RNA polymerase-binding transcription factor DksA